MSFKESLKEYKRVITLGATGLTLIAGLLIYQSHTTNAPSIKISAIPQHELYDTTFGPDTAPHHVLIYEALSCPHCREFKDETLDPKWIPLTEKGQLSITLRSMAIDYPSVLATSVLASLPNNTNKKTFLNTLFQHQEEFMERAIRMQMEAVRNKQSNISQDDLHKLFDPYLPANISVDILDNILSKDSITNKILTEQGQESKAIHLTATPTIIYNQEKTSLGEKNLLDPLNP